MSHKTLKPLLAASLVTMTLGFEALLIALLASTSGTHANGSGAYAGGISGNFFDFLLPVVIVVFITVFLVARRTFK